MAIGAASLATSVGCSFLYSLDSLSGGVGGDGGSLSADAALPDATLFPEGAPPRDDGMAPPEDSSAPTDAAGPHDAGADAPTFVPYWTFSDGFETGDLRRWPYSQQIAGATAIVVDGGAHTGCCAMQVLDPGTSSGSRAYVGQSWTPASPVLTAGTFAVRAWFKSVQLNQQNAFVALLQTQYGAATGATVGVQTASSGTGYSFYFYDSDTAVSGDFVASTASVALIDGAWHCFEAVLNISDSASTGQVSVFLDQESLSEFSAGSANLITDTDGGWSWGLIGFLGAQGSDPTNVYFDDTAMGLYTDLSPSIHIGCN